MPAVELLDKIINQLTSRKQVRVSQIPQISAKAWLINNLMTTPLIAKSGVLIVAKKETDKNKLISCLNFWQPLLKTNHFIYDLAKDKNTILLNLAKYRSIVIVADINDLKNKLPTQDIFLNNCLSIKTKQQISPQTVIKELTEHGYQRQTRVFLPNEVAKRGGIIDVFSNHDSRPIRIEFNDNVVDKIYYFDIASQKPVETISSVEIIPAQEIKDSLEVDISSYLNKNTLIVSPSDLKLPASDQKNYYLFWHELSETATIQAGFNQAPHYKYSLNQLATDIKNKPDWTIYLTSPDNIELETFSNLTVASYQPYLQSFINPKLKLWLITDEELTKFNKTNNQGKTMPMDELKVGNYVVHLDHGVARFAGLVRQTLDNVAKDYFCLHYAQGDKLFVPVERVDKISKYVGLARPQLHRLSGTSWTQALNKIKKETYQTAAKLINTTAQRQLVKVTPINQSYPEENELAHDFMFNATPDQIKAMTDINNDLAKDKPMDRLVCGDVGFGKTEIALRTAFKIVLNGGQVAMLCPTTILAQQHFDTFQERLKKYGVNIALLSRLKSTTDQQQTIKQIKSGKIDIVIGTHRLLSDDIRFKNLELIIIDEEQKFGVKHKEWLKSLRLWTHILTLSATPIPRTLYFSLTGIRPVSLIDTPPAGRLPVNTKINKYDEKLIKQALKSELKRGGQAYYLYNQVESIGIKAHNLKKIIPQAKLGIAHGQLPAKELGQVMHQFDTKKIDILICSTIIENGLDLPNVNTLIVEQAPKFGLAQLYQLRGRIGRGQRQAYAYFFYSAAKLTGIALKRLQALESAQMLGEGFAIAKRDMELRGIGNILGTKQHGQVKTVGLNLYLMLLEQAVEEIKTGKVKEPEHEITIDLPLVYNIPDELVSSQEKKFSLYQKLSRIKKIDGLDEFVRDNFTKMLPQEFSNLVNILKIKILCQKAGVNAIDTIYPRSDDIKIILYLSQEINSDKLVGLLNDNPAWNYKNNKLKIDKTRLGSPWIKKLMESLEILNK